MLRLQKELCLIVTQTTEPNTLQVGSSLNVTESTLIGRSADADLRLNDRTISRRHAHIAFEGDAWWVENLTANNGVFVDEVPLSRNQRRHLSDGAALQIGGVLFSVQHMQETVPVTSVMQPSKEDDAGPPPKVLPAPFLKLVRDGDHCTVHCKGRFVPMKPSAALALYALASKPGQVVHAWDIQEVMGSSYNLPQALSEVRRALLALLREGLFSAEELYTFLAQVAGGAMGEVGEIEANVLMRQLIVARRGHGYILKLPPSVIDIDEAG